MSGGKRMGHGRGGGVSGVLQHMGAVLNSFEQSEEQKKLQENWFRISLVMVDVVPRVTTPSDTCNPTSNLQPWFVSFAGLASGV